MIFQQLICEYCEQIGYWAGERGSEIVMLTSQKRHSKSICAKEKWTLLIAHYLATKKYFYKGSMVVVAYKKRVECL